MKNDLQGYIESSFFVLVVTQELCHFSFIKNVGEKISLLKSKAIFFWIFSPTCHRGDITIHCLLILS